MPWLLPAASVFALAALTAKRRALQRALRRRSCAGTGRACRTASAPTRDQRSAFSRSRSYPSLSGSVPPVWLGPQGDAGLQIHAAGPSRESGTGRGQVLEVAADGSDPLRGHSRVVIFCARSSRGRGGGWLGGFLRRDVVVLLAHVLLFVVSCRQPPTPTTVLRPA